MAIDPSSPTPLYHQIELALRARIEAGEWKPGEMIPTEMEICSDYGVSRTTARQALTNLVQQGSLVRKPGVGTFVRQSRIGGTIHGGLFHEKIREAGMTPRRKVLSFEVRPAKPEIAEALSITVGDPVWAVRRSYLGGDTCVICYGDIYIPRAIAPSLREEHFEELNTYEALAREGLRRKQGHASLEGRLASKEDCDILEIPEMSAVLTVTRLTYLLDGRPFELLEWVGRGDMVVLTTEFDSPYSLQMGLVRTDTRQEE